MYATVESVVDLLAARHSCRYLAAFIACVGLATASESYAEWYAAGQFGINFADRLSNIAGTGGLSNPSIEPRFSSFDLANSYTYGGKLGNFIGNGWFGIELDVFHSTPNIKQLDEIAGTHMRVTSVGLNFIARYPGLTYQPYVGVGGAMVIGHISSAPNYQHDTDVTSGLNLLGGLRAFVTPYVAVFVEYKYTQATFQFDQAFGSAGGFSGDYKAQQLLFGISYHFSFFTGR